MSATPLRIFTVGHSTRPFDEFVRILRAHGVEAVADVRLIPQSRKFPHFGSAFLAANLPGHGIAYLPFIQLGGRRKALANSPNTGWRNESFRGYADFMQTEAFRRAIEELMTAARERRTTTLCAEAVPWRCHRSLISDALLIRGCEVLDIMTAKKVTPHKLTRFARVDGTRITYPASDDGDPSLFTMEAMCRRGDKPAAVRPRARQSLRPATSSSPRRP